MTPSFCVIYVIYVIDFYVNNVKMTLRHCVNVSK